jgi:hypothetical protein
MLRALYDRLAYACIGFTLGSVVAFVLWYLYGLGFSSQVDHPVVTAGLVSWIKYVGGFFAVIGFLFRDRVGEAIGNTSREVYDYEVDRHADPEVPRWLVALVLVGVVGIVWYALK